MSVLTTDPTPPAAGRAGRIDLSRSAPPAFLPVVVAPTFNNGTTLLALLGGLDLLGLDVVVVDDGSTDDTAKLLADWKRSGDGRRQVVSHPRNRGKGAALQTGFARAVAAGFTHAVTIDTDGQLSPADIPKLLEKARAKPDALVLGTRDAGAADYPSRSRWGRSISNWLIRCETGKSVADSQCGLRVYPLENLRQLRCRHGHFGFESEIITRAMWTGVKVAQVPVACRYFDVENRVSHFKPWLDSVRAMRLHGRLIFAAANPLPWPKPSPGSAPPRSLGRQFLHWLNPVSAWRQVRGDEADRTRFAAGFAIGVFIANLPLYGLQTIASLFVARRFRLHPVSVIAGTNVAIPPIGPLLIVGGVSLGHFVLHGNFPRFSNYNFSAGHWTQVLLPMLLEWLIGGFLLGLLLAGLTFLGLDFFLRWLAARPVPTE